MDGQTDMISYAYFSLQNAESRPKVITDCQNKGGMKLNENMTSEPQPAVRTAVGFGVRQEKSRRLTLHTGIH
jgi:hypothetical protein